MGFFSSHLGIIAGSVLLARFVGILFGVFEPGSVLASIMVIPEFIWELLLGIWLIVKGFNSSAAILSDYDKTDIDVIDKLSLART